MRRLPSGRLPAPLHDASGHPDGVLFRIVKVGTAEVVGQGYESDMPAAAIPTVATCRLDGRVRRDPLYAGGGLLLVHYPGPSLKSTRAERSSTGAGLSVRAVDVIERGKKATHSRVIDTVMLHLRLPAGFHEALVIPDGRRGLRRTARPELPATQPERMLRLASDGGSLRLRGTYEGREQRQIASTAEARRPRT